MHKILTITVLFWAGFVSSISFLEAWIKFRAEGVTQVIGLSIGKKVFTAMNRVEWIFLLIFLLSVLIPQLTDSYGILTGGSLVAILLSWQTFYLLPALNKRAVMIINGNLPKKSTVHLLYGVAETVKVAALLVTGYLLVA
jgi:hypothetical protein